MSRPINKLDKAARLFSLGYRAHLRNGTIICRNPGGTEYEIDPGAKRCSCDATVTCSHLLGLYGLMLDTANSLAARAHGHIECVQNCWRFTEDGMRLANRAAALSDHARSVLVLFEGWQVWVDWEAGVRWRQIEGLERERLAA